ncbi:MAG: hypothetical protein IT302_16230 [Dehalococcoidia bacterium]|nr:hypothetical protein [Dehalococcoidia bacterium]
MQYRLLRLLKTAPQRDAFALAERLVLTDTAVRQHLGVLEAMGLVAGTTARDGQGRGRPRTIYTTTPLADQYVPDASLKLLVTLARHCAATRPQTLGTWLRGHFRGIFEKWLKGRDVPAGARSAVEFAAAAGAIMSYEESPAGDLTVRVHQCPIASLAREVPLVCDVELEVLRELLPGFETVRVASKPGGHIACEFRARPRKD